MTTSITQVVQTELGRLVGRREELVEEISKVRRNLKQTQVCDPDRFEAARKQTEKYLADALEALVQKQAAADEAKSLRKLTTNKDIIEWLESGHYDSPKTELANTLTNIKGYETELAQACSDPRVTLTNSLAQLELALAGVKAEIKEASK